MIDVLGANPSSLNNKETFRETRAILKRRAKFLNAIRTYLDSQSVIEVETPLLYDYPVSDPHIQNLTVASSLYFDRPRYLQSSPESNLKQLLAKNSGSIYQLGKVFRDDPQGRWHSQEFTMLEWYRIGFDLEDLIEDICRLLDAVGFEGCSVTHSTYAEVFERYCKFDPFSVSLEQIRQYALKMVAADLKDLADCDDRNMWLDILMSHCVQPQLGRGGFEFLYDYPSDQAALADVTVDEKGRAVAKRCELFYDGIELANAYQELCDADEFERRFQIDVEVRQRLKLPAREIDQGLLAAMRQGLPACAGVALGVDRLLAVYVSNLLAG